MARFISKTAVPLGDPREAEQKQLKADFGKLIANPSKRDIPGNISHDFFQGNLSFEDAQAQIQGSPTFNPNIGPQINEGQGARSATPEDLAKIASGNVHTRSYPQAPQAAQINPTQQAMQSLQAEGTPLTAAAIEGRGQKLRGAFEQVQGTEVPPTMGEAGLIMDKTMKGMPGLEAATTPNVDNFFLNNPDLQTSMAEVSKFLSPPETQNRIAERLSELETEQTELAGLKLERINNKRLRGATEGQIREEVEKAGGFATDSQVKAMTIARNKTLLEEAALIEDQLAFQQDAVANDLTLLQFERDMANTQFNQRMGILQLKQRNDEFIFNANRDAMRSALDFMGPDGLVESANGDPNIIARHEKSLGWLPGTLVAAGEIVKQERDAATAREELEQENIQSQINARKTVGSGAVNLTPFQQLSARNLSVQIFGKRAGAKPENFGLIQDLMKGGMNADEIQDELRFEGQSEQFEGTIRDAAENIAIGIKGADNRKFFMDSLDRHAESGDTERMKETLLRGIEGSLDTTTKGGFKGDRRAVELLDEISTDLAEYEAKGGNTGLFRGSLQKMTQRLGRAGTPELVGIGNKIAIAIQRYRKAISGAAFTESESREYQRVFPSTSRVGELNTELINSAREVLQGNVEFIMSEAMGANAFREIFGGTAGMATPAPKLGDSVGISPATLKFIEDNGF